MPGPSLLTIGHSGHTEEHFSTLLLIHEVTCVADVRSAPFSGLFPQYNRPELSAALRDIGIEYVFFGDELGGRSKAASDYDPQGRVRYERMAAAPAFKQGIQTLLELAAGERVALMCAEKDPLDCHRMLLVGRTLDSAGASVAHIHDDGSLETTEAAISRLLLMHGMQDDALFEPRERLISEAVERQARKVAFIDPRMQAKPSVPLA